MLKKVNPEIDQQAFVIIEEEVRAVMREALAADALNEQITYPIYHRHLSAADIQALVDFYKTPAGRRVLAALPVITEEGRRARTGLGCRTRPEDEGTCPRATERRRTRGLTWIDRSVEVLEDLHDLLDAASRTCHLDDGVRLGSREQSHEIDHAVLRHDLDPVGVRILGGGQSALHLE